MKISRYDDAHSMYEAAPTAVGTPTGEGSPIVHLHGSNLLVCGVNFVSKRVDTDR